MFSLNFQLMTHFCWQNELQNQAKETTVARLVQAGLKLLPDPVSKQFVTKLVKEENFERIKTDSLPLEELAPHVSFSFTSNTTFFISLTICVYCGGVGRNSMLLTTWHLKCI